MTLQKTKDWPIFVISDKDIIESNVYDFIVANMSKIPTLNGPLNKIHIRHRNYPNSPINEVLGDEMDFEVWEYVEDGKAVMLESFSDQDTAEFCMIMMYYDSELSSRFIFFHSKDEAIEHLNRR